MSVNGTLVRLKKPEDKLWDEVAIKTIPEKAFLSNALSDHREHTCFKYGFQFSAIKKLNLYAVHIGSDGGISFIPNAIGMAGPRGYFKKGITSIMVSERRKDFYRKRVSKRVVSH